MQRLFVYGTLAPNKENEHILSDIEGTWEEGTIKGNLLQEGWGAKMGCPGIVLDETANKVKGLVFSSKQLDKKWQILDELEGSDYNRVIVKATLTSGETLDTYVYELNK